MSQKNTLGNRIIELRKIKDWSQSDLAAQVGVSYAQIGRYETKGSQPPAAVLKKIADALDTGKSGDTDKCIPVRSDHHLY
jgi:transcriptional regulator with XRE-family HTH domain